MNRKLIRKGPLRWRGAFSLLGTSSRVRFARVRAIIWALVGVASFPLGWAQSVVLVWIASVYANVASEMAAGEAADDHAVLDRLDRLSRAVKPSRRRKAARTPPPRRSKLTAPLSGRGRYPGSGRHRT